MPRLRPSAKLAFVDVETTGLDPARHEMFELAVMCRDPDHEFTRRKPMEVGGRGDRERERWQQAKDAWDWTWTMHYWIWPMNLERAESGALRVNDYHSRSEVQRDKSGGTQYKPRSVLAKDRLDRAQEIASKLSGAYLVGCNPSFDASFIEAFLRKHRQAPGWHHRKVDVESMAMGVLGKEEPPGLSKLVELLDLDTGKARHTAMDDVQLTMEAFDKLRMRQSNMTKELGVGDEG